MATPTLTLIIRPTLPLLVIQPLLLWAVEPLPTLEINLPSPHTHRISLTLAHRLTPGDRRLTLVILLILRTLVPMGQTKVLCRRTRALRPRTLAYPALRPLTLPLT